MNAATVSTRRHRHRHTHKIDATINSLFPSQRNALSPPSFSPSLWLFLLFASSITFPMLRPHTPTHSPLASNRVFSSPHFFQCLPSFHTSENVSFPHLKVHLCPLIFPLLTPSITSLALPSPCLLDMTRGKTAVDDLSSLAQPPCSGVFKWPRAA